MDDDGALLDCQQSPRMARFRAAEVPDGDYARMAEARREPRPFA